LKKIITITLIVLITISLSLILFACNENGEVRLTLEEQVQIAQETFEGIENARSSSGDIANRTRSLTSFAESDDYMEQEDQFFSFIYNILMTPINELISEIDVQALVYNFEIEYILLNLPDGHQYPFPHTLNFIGVSEEYDTMFVYSRGIVQMGNDSMILYLRSYYNSDTDFGFIGLAFQYYNDDLFQIEYMKIDRNERVANSISFRGDDLNGQNIFPDDSISDEDKDYLRGIIDSAHNHFLLTQDMLERQNNNGERKMLSTNIITITIDMNKFFNI